MATPFHTALGLTVARIRRDRGQSQQELATNAHLGLSTLTKIERGAIKNPSVFSILAIAKALNVSVEELLQSEIARHSGMSQPVRFIYFDIHGVMATNWERVFTELARRYQIEPQAIEMAFWRYNDIVGRGDPQVHAIMAQLAEHYQIGLFTNIFPGFLDRLREMGVVPALPYAAVIESCEVGSVKPETAIFSQALAQTNTTADRVMLVDDTHANIDVAKKLGWQGYWFDEQHSAPAIASLRTMLLPG
jgi:FMN phosphatase YigB (HAD superfamily)/DNA-binding Xre family transcriptional regulator